MEIGSQNVDGILEYLLSQLSTEVRTKTSAYAEVFFSAQNLLLPSIAISKSV
jgi:hypothetical protein